jgi:hypothetical protein
VTELVYVVVPHPDDELEAWSLLEDRADQYPVLVLCTHGEQTVYADGRGHQPELGERTPLPQPWGARGSPTVRAQRLGSFSAFLDGGAALDPHLDAELVDHGVLDDGPSPFTVAVGERSARVVFDGGDGRLTPEFVTAVLQRTRALRRTHLPVQQEGGAIGAAYWNTAPGSVRAVPGGVRLARTAAGLAGRRDRRDDHVPPAAVVLAPLRLSGAVPSMS